MDERWRDERRALIQVARGKAPADLVLRNARLVNVFSNEIQPADVAIYQDRVAGVGAPGSYGGRARTGPQGTVSRARADRGAHPYRERAAHPRRVRARRGPARHNYVRQRPA